MALVAADALASAASASSSRATTSSTRSRIPDAYLARRRPARRRRRPPASRSRTPRTGVASAVASGAVTIARRAHRPAPTYRRGRHLTSWPTSTSTAHRADRPGPRGPHRSHDPTPVRPAPPRRPTRGRPHRRAAAHRRRCTAHPAAGRSAPATACSSPARRASSTRITLEPGRRVPHPPRRARARRRDRPARRLGHPRTRGDEYLALRPLLNDFVMSMPRGAAIVYPKDAAQILALADVFPGATRGRGRRRLRRAVALAAARHRADRAAARRSSAARSSPTSPAANVAAFLGAVPDNWSVTVGDLVEALPTPPSRQSVDRVVLDMLAPWECVDAAADALEPGGVVLCYVATVTQLSRVAEAIREHRPLHRPAVERDDGAHLARRGPRRPPRPPDGRPHRLPRHRAAAGPRRRAPELKRRAVEVGVLRRRRRGLDPGCRSATRSASDKRLRKVVRQAAARPRSPPPRLRPRPRTPGCATGRLRPSRASCIRTERGSVRTIPALLVTIGLAASLTGCASQRRRHHAVELHRPRRRVRGRHRDRRVRQGSRRSPSRRPLTHQGHAGLRAMRRATGGRSRTAPRS